MSYKEMHMHAVLTNKLYVSVDSAHVSTDQLTLLFVFVSHFL